MSMREPRPLYPVKSGFVKAGKISSILVGNKKAFGRIPERTVNDSEKVECVLPPPPPRASDVYTCDRCKMPVSIQQDFHGWLSGPSGQPEACPKCSKPVIRARTRRKVRAQLKNLVQEGTLLDMQNLPDNAERYALAKYPGNQQYVEVIQDFINGDTKELFFTGPTGRGKSGLAISAAHVLHAQGKLVLFMTMEQYLDLLRENMAPGAQQNNIKNIMKGVDVAIIDDLGAGVLSENSTGFAVKEAQDLIEARHAAGLQTLISSNLAIDGLAGYWYMAKYERAGFQPSERIISRLKGWYRSVEIVGPDLRLGE